MKLPLLALLALPYIAIGQSVGDIIIQKATISGATEVYVTPSPTTILGLNDSGEPSLISLGAGVTLPSGTLTISPAWSAITSTPTTLAGYGITDAQPLDATLTALSGQSTTAFGLTTLAWANAAAGRSALELGSAATLGASEIGIPGYVAMYDVSGSLLSNNQVNVVDGDYTAGYAANNVIWSDAGLGNSAVLALPTLTGQTWTLPTDSGTLALTSQITTALTNYAGSANVDTLGVVNVGTWNADSIADGYIDSAVTWNNKQDGDTQLTSLSGLSYASNAGKFVRVNGGETGFELAAITGTGTVTSVAGAGTVNGLTLTGTVTTSGSLTLGGTLSGVDLTSAVSGALPVANGGTGSTSLPSVTHYTPAAATLSGHLSGIDSALASATGIGGTTGATDNAVLRANGTGGSTVQSSAVTIDDGGNVNAVTFNADYQINALYHWVSAQQAALRTNNYFADGGGLGLSSGAYIGWTNGATATTGTVEQTISRGAGSPEGVKVAPVGSLYLRTDGGTGTTLYIKESGTGNTGWAAK